MTNFSERKEASANAKNEVLNALREQPLYFYDLLDMFNLEHRVLTNYLTSLKRFSLIHFNPADMEKAHNKRRWVAVPNAPTYHEALELAKKVPGKKYAEKQDGSIPGATVIYANDYHTKGTSHKLSAWSGYTSF